MARLSVSFLRSTCQKGWLPQPIAVLYTQGSATAICPFLGSKRTYFSELSNPWPGRGHKTRHPKLQEALGAGEEAKQVPESAEKLQEFYGRKIIGTDGLEINAGVLKDRIKQSSWFRQVAVSVSRYGKEPETAKPSHYTNEVKSDPNNYYRLRTKAEMYPPEDAPYQHTPYIPENDTSAQLYQNFRVNAVPGDIIALREKAPGSFIPGTAQPFLLPFNQHWSIHYERQTSDSEAGDHYGVMCIWSFLHFAIFMWGFALSWIYVYPESGGVIVYSD